MSNTQDNLHQAFAGESQANREYLFFADKAAKEGFPQIARLFRAAAEAETVHARNHFEVLGGVKSTKENLQAAIKGEFYEFTRMYPSFISQAKTEKNLRAELSFNKANSVEEVHHSLFQSSLKDLEEGKKIKEQPIFVCQICGETLVGGAEEHCPVCGSAKNNFKKIE